MSRSSAEVRRVFVHHILEDEVDGHKEEQGDQRDGDEEEEVNGDIEAIRETKKIRMNHEDGMTQVNECGLELEPMRCDQPQGTKTGRIVHCATNKDRTDNKEEALKTNKLSCGSVHSAHESSVDVLMSVHMLNVIPHVVGLVAVCRDTNSLVVKA